MKNQNPNQNSKLIEIKSVGSVIDTDSGNIYPLNQDGTVDYTFGISLENEEVSSDWYDGLSVQDLKKVKYIQQFLQIFPQQNGYRGFYVTNNFLQIVEKDTKGEFKWA